VPSEPPGWVRDAVFYQIFPDRFASSDRVPKPGPLEAWDAPPSFFGFKGGDLLGVAERLDYLGDLGITALYLNPIFASAANHRYHAYDYLAVDPLLGGDGAFRELLDAAHARGMRVILDGVFNHTGRGFWPFHHVMEAGRHSPYRDWFHFNQRWLDAEIQIRAYPEATLPGAIDPDWAERHGPGIESLEELGYRAWWDLPPLPKLNVAHPAVREYLLGVAEHWIRFGADGWRLDVAEEIGVPDFWPAFRHTVRVADPEAYLVGEIWRVAPEWCSADRFDGLMNYPLAWALIGYAGGPVLDASVAGEHGYIGRVLRALDGPAFAARLTELLTAYPTGTAAHLNLIGSHDTPRVLTLCGGDAAAVRMAMLLMLTLPGAPCVYYGDEVGMSGRVDPQSRGAFIWDPATWDGSLHAWLRDALLLRASQPALRGDALRILAADRGACAYLRSDGDTHLVVVANAGADACTLDLTGLEGRSMALALATDGREPAAVAIDAGAATLDLAARWAGVLRVAS